MRMPVMNIRKMRVRVRNRQVNMRVGMRLIAAVGKVVLMPMVLVMTMPMIVRKRTMSMQMLMTLANVQPDP